MSAVSPSPNVHIRQMTAAEIPMAINWAADEGWNPGLNDAACFFAMDPEGFFVAEVEGHPVGCISAVRYGVAFGFLGLYIVVPAQRGKGYGIALWNRAMAHLAGRNVGLDGVLAQQDNYKKSGFQLAHRNIRYQLDTGKAVEVPVPAAAHPEIRLVAMADVDVDAILNFDQEHFLFPRKNFLRLWISQPDSIAIAALKADGSIAGYAVMRKCITGYKIGPLFSQTEDVAQLLFTALVSQATTGPIFLDIPERNPAAVVLVKQHKMVPMFETARMYTNGDPGLPLNRIYGITSFELG